MRAMRHCNAHVSSKYGSYAGRASALAAYYYTSEKVISSPEPAPEEAYDVRYNFGKLPSAFIHWIAYAKEKKGKAQRFEIAARAYGPIGLRRGIRALKKNVVRRKWMRTNMGVGDRVFARRTKCRAFGRWKSMWKRRRSLLWASLKFSKKSVKSKVILRWKKATRNSITDHVVASASPIS